MPRSPSALVRSLEPLVAAVWIFFWVWTALVAVIWAGGVEGGGEMSGWLGRVFPKPTGLPGASPLADAAALFGAAIDPVWMALAAANCYFSLAAEQGLPRARRWTLWIIAASFAAGLLSTWTGWPLGWLRFTSRFGPRLGPVPLGWILLWCVLVLGARETMRCIFRRATHGQTALGAGVLVALTYGNLHALASRERVLWFWPAGREPIWTGAGWFLVGAALVYTFRAGGEISRANRGFWVLVALNSVFLVTHAVR